MTMKGQKVYQSRFNTWN